MPDLSTGLPTGLATTTAAIAFLTIGRLATKAGVGVETIRYYQTRGLLPVPHNHGGYRQYPVTLIDRIRFIKRAQELGFSLDEIAELLRLDEKTDRNTIRHIASKKMEQIQQKITDLSRMQHTLETLVSSCAHTSDQQCCPIIATLAGSTDA